MIQAEHKVWVDKKYPNQLPEIPAAGCVEEAGELLHAVLKLRQIELWGEDARYTIIKSRAKLVDAIGDCAIYACSLCNANDWNFEEVWNVGHYEGVVKTELELAVQLVVMAANVAAMPKSRIAIGHYILQLKTISYAVGIDANSALLLTWATVRER